MNKIEKYGKWIFRKEEEGLWTRPAIIKWRRWRKGLPEIPHKKERTNQEKMEKVQEAWQLEIVGVKAKCIWGGSEDSCNILSVDKVLTCNRAQTVNDQHWKKKAEKQEAGTARTDDSGEELCPGETSARRNKGKKTAGCLLNAKTKQAVIRVKYILETAWEFLITDNHQSTTALSGVRYSKWRCPLRT